MFCIFFSYVELVEIVLVLGNIGKLKKIEV